MEDGRVAYGVLVGDLMKRKHLKDVDRRIILKRIFFKWDGETWTGLLWFRIGTSGGCL